MSSGRGTTPPDLVFQRLLQCLTADGSNSELHWCNCNVLWNAHSFTTGLLRDRDFPTFAQKECTSSYKYVTLLLLCCPITMIPKQWMQMTKYVGLLFFMNFFFLPPALKRQSDKHASVHPPLSTTVPLCGSYGKSNFTHHGLCRLLSISSTQFLWRHCDFINQ